jgi:hypothetical protein
MRGSRCVALTGDPELDACVPRFPRVIPEITWVAVSDEKVIPAGTLDPLILPAQIGGTPLKVLLSRVDGQASLEDLLADGTHASTNQRDLLRLLFRLGMIEDGRVPADSSTAFAALAMDQTRLHSDRVQAARASRRSLHLVGSAPSLRVALISAGINLHENSKCGLPAFQVVVLDCSGRPCTSQNPIAGVRVLPVRFHGSSVDIGPWLPSASMDHIGTLQQHIGDDGIRPVEPSTSDLLQAMCAHTLTMILGATTAIVMPSSLHRITWDDSGMRVERVPLSAHLGGPNSLSEEVSQKLSDRAASAVPALQDVGTKAHESHHSRRNILTSLELQRGSIAACKRLPGHSRHSHKALLTALSMAFGYTAQPDGSNRRNCPSGGNIGSPEALVWVNTPGMLYVYRYLPLSNALEQVLGTRPAVGSPHTTGLICIGNKEKLCRKYGPLGHALVRLDAGVARAFFRASAAILGIELREARLQRNAPAEVCKLIADRSYHYDAPWEIVIQPADARIPQPALNTLQQRRFAAALAKRRSVRTFSRLPPDLAQFCVLASQSRPVATTAMEELLLHAIVPLVRAIDDGKQSVHVISQTGIPANVSSSTRPDELFLQRSLNQAPLALFLTVDMRAVLNIRSEYGLDGATLLCGEWMGRLWLGLDSHQLAGCPCGAAVETELQALLPPGFRHLSVLASFVAGLPEQ